MATRSLIGKYDGADEWKCRYVHWDGYPEGVGVTVCKIIARDGADKAMSILLDENTSWSVLDAESGDDPDGRDRQGHHTLGYGWSHDERWDWIERGDDTGAEYAYIIVPHQSMLDVYKWDYESESWRYIAAMDCLTRKMLTTTGELKVMA